MNYTKILMSASMIAFVVALAYGGTQAFFSDEEVSNGNTFSAGAIDLQIDNSSYGFDWNDPTVDNPSGEWGPNDANSWQLTDLTDELFFSFVDLKPGDYGEDTISLHVNNNDAYACMAFDLTGTPENGQNEPEAEVDTSAGADEGELQDHLSFMFWYDDGDNVLETDEDVIPELSGLPGSIFSGTWLPIAEAGDEPLPAEETVYIGKGWCFGEMTATPVAPGDYGAPTASTTGFSCNGAGDHNEAQTDGLVVDVAFHAEQSRNNGQFSCAALPPLDGNSTSTPTTTPEVLVGAVLGDYSTSTVTCDVLVDENGTTTTIAAGLALASSGQTVCVADGTYNETVDIEIQDLTLASLTGPLNTATINGGVIIDASGVTVTGFVVIPGNTEGSTAGFYLKEAADNAEISYNEIDASGVANARGVVNVIGTDLPGVMIDNNYIHGPGNSGSGIYTNPHTGMWTISNNDISDFAAGIGQWNGANVTNNIFSHSTPGSEAIGVDNAWDVNGGVVNFNNFLDGTKLNTYTTIVGIIDAEDNFFNLGGATQVDETNGDVDFDPEAVAQYPHN